MRNLPRLTLEGLRRFLEGDVLPWFDNRKKELANRPLICEQAFGESLDPDKLESLGRFGKNGLCPVVAPKTRRFLTGGKSFVGRLRG